MSNIVRIIGAIVFSLLMYIVPVALVCSFVYNWHVLFKIICVYASVFQFCFLVAAVFMKAEEGET